MERNKNVVVDLMVVGKQQKCVVVVVVVVVVKGIKQKDSCVGGFCREEVIEMWR